MQHITEVRGYRGVWEDESDQFPRSGLYPNRFLVSPRRQTVTDHFEEIVPMTQFDLNRYFKNTIEDLLKRGQERPPSLLCDERLVQLVHLYGRGEDVGGGGSSPEQMGSQLEVEVSLSANGYPKSGWNYIVNFRDFDDCEVEAKRFREHAFEGWRDHKENRDMVEGEGLQTLRR